MTVATGRSAIPKWLSAIVVVGVVLMVLGGIIALGNPAMLAPTGGEINGAVRVYAGYLFSRNVAIAAMLLCALIIRARRAVSYLMLLTAVIQILDATLDCLEGRWVIAPGVMLLGIAFLFGAVRAANTPLWKIEAWRDPQLNQ